MDIFSNTDVDFSKEFYKYLSDSYDKHVQDKILKETNNKIIKYNISKLEDCIKNNLNKDNTQPFDKTFICDGFQYLIKNNNNITEGFFHIKQFEKPMSKINLTKTLINNDKIEFDPAYESKTLYGTYRCKSDVIPKNTYDTIRDTNRLIVRMSNTQEEKESYNVQNSVYWR
jgi:hypothetical protein